MGSVYFDHFETGSQCALGRVNKGLNDLGDLDFIELPWVGVLRVKGNRRRAYRHPAAVFGFNAAMVAKPRPMGAGFTPGVRQLDAGHSALERR